MTAAMTGRDLERLAAAGVYGPSDDDAEDQRTLLEDLVGLPVHLAARIVAAAGPATVLTSRELRDRVAGSIFRSAGTHALAGFGDPVELFELLPDQRSAG